MGHTGFYVCHAGRNRILLCVFLFSLICTSLGFFTERPFPEYACGAIYEGSAGTLESPLFPEPYPPDVDCFWQIKAPVGARIRVTSQLFYVEENPECLYDYVLIQDGEYGESAKAVYCGTRTIDFLSDNNVIYIRFVTDASNQDAGFRISFERVSLGLDCNLTISQPGVVTSPNYPHPYPPNTVCLHYIESPEDTVIKLKFHDFHVESTPCQFDRLEIYQGMELTKSNKLSTLCGRSLPATLTLPGNYMTLRLVTDDNVQTRGFNATVHFLSVHTTPTSEVNPDVTSRSPMSVSRSGSEPVNFNGCNITLEASVMNISSPKFPMKYPDSAHCTVKLRSELTSTYVINLLIMDIEEEENCTYDSLSIFTYEPTAETHNSLLRRLCGHDVTDTLMTYEGHGLDLVFKSDSSVSESGYLANVVVTPLNHKGSSCVDVCKNGGSCVEILTETGDVDWKCHCPETHTGPRCDVILQSCDTVTCQNGGTCREEAGWVVCDCHTGYRGDVCEEKIQSPPVSELHFLRVSGNMTLGLGSSVILECAVSDSKARIMWLYHDRILSAIDASRGVEIYPGGVLHISKVKDEHSGRYTCMALTSDDLIEKSLWIHLTEPCSLDVKRSPTNTTVREGQAAMFECFVPNADVTLWRKDGDPIQEGPRKRVLVNDYLVISNVVGSDAGEYTCAARGAQGCFSRTSAFLTVEPTGHEEECGKASTKSLPDLLPRISSGQESPAGSAPWHAILRDDRPDMTFCGGTLISPDTVLTAAHCVVQFFVSLKYPFDHTHIDVVLGSNSCLGKEGVHKRLRAYKLHPEYNDTSYFNDIAIFKLEEPVTLSEDIMPICLESKDFIDELLKPGRKGVVTGCGRRYHGISPKILQEVHLPVVQRQICVDRAAVINATVTPGMFCAGYARGMRGDACQGDSGGPYVMEFSGRSILAGIVSWGVDCDVENHYGYYTHAGHYYDWVMENMDKI